MIAVVPVDPPREGLVLPSLVETTSLSEFEAVTVYEAAVADVLRAVDESGADLLVNYRDDGTLPEPFADGEPEAEVRALAAEALGDDAEHEDDSVRFERQVGSTRSARIGNTVTHLLEREDAGNVGVVEPTVPLVGRSEIDGVAMALRRHDVVLGPSSAGRAYVAGFTDTIDFTDAYATPALSTLADRAAEAGLDIGFAPSMPSVATADGLCSTIAALEAHRHAGRPIAAATAAAVDEVGLAVGADETLERVENR
ncbi:hypothetical protein [Halopiger djelfimassiliensis]|uniref:hypothetical protein n=1 Tax=Halopiger djelfimassiliensis TaxID=1293047 RepID=UPI000677F5B1|nr:hypothetical protein [Halopiger djelfimassiliensis]